MAMQHLRHAQMSGNDPFAGLAGRVGAAAPQKPMVPCRQPITHTAAPGAMHIWFLTFCYSVLPSPAKWSNGQQDPLPCADSTKSCFQKLLAYCAMGCAYIAVQQRPPMSYGAEDDTDSDHARASSATAHRSYDTLQQAASSGGQQQDEEAYQTKAKNANGAHIPAHILDDSNEVPGPPLIDLDSPDMPASRLDSNIKTLLGDPPGMPCLYEQRPLAAGCLQPDTSLCTGLVGGGLGSLGLSEPEAAPSAPGLWQQMPRDAGSRRGSDGLLKIDRDWAILGNVGPAGLQAPTALQTAWADYDRTPVSSPVAVAGPACGADTLLPSEVRDLQANNLYTVQLAGNCRESTTDAGGGDVLDFWTQWEVGACRQSTDGQESDLHTAATSGQRQQAAWHGPAVSLLDT